MSLSSELPLYHNHVLVCSNSMGELRSIKASIFIQSRGLGVKGHKSVLALIYLCYRLVLRSMFELL